MGSFSVSSTATYAASANSHQPRDTTGLRDPDGLRTVAREFLDRPELAFEEVETAAFVAARLRELGVDEVHTGIARTGVVGVLRAGRGSGSIGLRADMDALPIRELTGLPHASTVDGRMHACGHDGHTTMLLGAARYLAETRNTDGTVYLIFQPAEEGAGGGRRMIEEGLFERFPAERVYGLHNWPALPVGSFAMCPGPAMAAADQFSNEITGVGGHAAMPHLCKDPIVAASLMVQAFSTIVAREVDPVDQAVISVSRIHAGDAYNVIPEQVTMLGTVRTFRAATQELIERRMGEVVAGIAAAQGLEGRLDYRRGYPPTVNHARDAAIGADAAADIVGEEHVDRAPLPCMGAEDFAFMLERRPGSYIWMGNGGGDAGRNLHSPHYDFNDEALPFGVSWWVRLVERSLPAR